MRTPTTRRLLLRSLPVLLVAVLAIAGRAPQQISESGPAAAHAHGAADPELSDVVAERPVAAAPADRTDVLVTQHTAGVRGSRGPPAAAA
ncbi:hypothetical protein GCM10010172_68030 [Paractinoplanes ferrugineus]|uniref:Uncharacterized protein n=1 Tax=Paractinoplanes ferrugineus TaxID=113564 RepID=A0A919JBD9_9ACTN|nr:hypothetical protein [Actinoplanes ferrugineus]GIE16543.1 hypothetical protein Afe05nite_83830 [Actinoplanes ferrugineus]